MITIGQYFGSKPKPIQHEANANILLAQVNLCLKYAADDDCYEYLICPNTNSQISGSKGGNGGGGYRLPSDAGAMSSAHKEAQAVDVYDPERKLAKWCVKNKDKLHNLGLYCEDFRWTSTWCHFQTRKSRSGHVIYIPFDPAKTPPAAPALEGQAELPFRVK